MSGFLDDTLEPDPLVGLLEAALTAVTLSDDIDVARGIAIAALYREGYHGHHHEVVADG